MFVLRNQLSGEHFICQLAWSGGNTFEFDLDSERDEQYDGRSNCATSLFFKAGPEAPAPLRVLAPGRDGRDPRGASGGWCWAISTLACRRCMTTCAVASFCPKWRRAWRRLRRESVPELEITEERVFEFIEVGGRLGAEVFFIDARLVCRAEQPLVGDSGRLGGWQPLPSGALVPFASARPSWA